MYIHLKHYININLDDGAINKASGQVGGQERELEPWQGDVDDSIESLYSFYKLIFYL